MEKMNTKAVIAMLESVALVMKCKREYLIELDSAIGDGDLGITMDRAYQAAYAYAKENPNFKPGELLMRCGMQIVKVAPSTMGTLMGSGLMRGGKSVIGKEDLTSSDLTLFFEGFLQGILDRGKAKRGEKTIVDVLYPLVDAMKAYQGSSIYGVLQAGVEGAHRGLENEKGMMSQRGKAAVFREKTKDLVDPGSMAILILIEACRDGVTEKEEIK